MARRRRAAKKSRKKSSSSSPKVLSMLSSINKKVTRIDHKINEGAFKKRKARREEERRARVMAEGGL